jgi:hypothetical protein
MKLSDEGYRALSILHGFLEGSTTKAVIAFKLASIVGIPTQQFIDAVNELDKTGLVIFNKTTHAVWLTKRGIDEIEKAPNQSNNTTNIYGPNYGPLQQGGQGNVQNVTVNAQFDAKLNELFALVENSSLTPVQKLKAVNDINTVRELSRLETTPEVQEEARTRIEGVTSVISLSADLLSVGMPIIEIIRAFFGL